MTRELRAELQEALVRLADGDREALAPLFARLWPLLRRFATRFLQDSPEAEDAAQQALLKVYARASEFDPGRDALSWIFGIVAYECRTFRRRVQRRREELAPPEELTGRWADEADLERQLVEKDLEEAASELLEALTPADRETVLVSMRGEPRPAGVAPATFRKRLERALQRLRTAWKVKYGTL